MHEYGATVVVCSHHRVARSIDRLGSARLDTRCAALRPRPDEERCGGGACPLTTTVRLILAWLRAHFGSYASGSVEPAIPTLQPCQFNHSMGALDFFPLLSFLFFLLPFFLPFLPTLFYPPLRLQTRRISSATRRVPRVNKRSDSLVSRTTPPCPDSFFTLLEATHRNRATGYLFLHRYKQRYRETDRIGSVSFATRFLIAETSS